MPEITPTTGPTETQTPRARRKPGPKPRSDLDAVTIIGDRYRTAPVDVRPVIRAIVKCGDVNVREFVTVIEAVDRLTAETTQLLLAMLDALDGAEAE